MELSLDLGADVGNVKVDPGQLEQMLLNLAVNARHAMPRGGALTLTTDAARPDRADDEAVPGADDYVRLTFKDTGVGMDADTQALIFDPLFTTRPQGEGTGLGLATVSGIVQQSGGVIEVESEPGQGTSFRDLPSPRRRAAGAGRPAACVHSQGREGMRPFFSSRTRTPCAT